MKIGIDASGVYGWRGPSRNITNIIKTLIRVDKHNHYYLFTPYDPIPGLTPQNNYEWVKINKIKCISWRSFSLPIAAIIMKIDVFLFPQADFWLWKPKKTVVLTRSAAMEAYTQALADRMQAFFSRVLFSRIVDKVGAVSHFCATQNQLVSGVSDEKIEIIYNGVDPIFGDPNIRPNDRYGRYMLFAGGTEPRKNINRLLLAFKQLTTKDHKINLVLVGGKYTPTEPDMDSINGIIAKLALKDRVILHGIEKDKIKLAGLYKGAQLVVYPSLQEVFGMVSVEAMASGVPLVASYAPSIPEIAGDAAVYFDPYDVEEMAEKMELALRDTDLRKRLIEKGLDRVKKFSWETSAKKLLNLLEGVAPLKKWERSDV